MAAITLGFDGSTGKRLRQYRYSKTRQGAKDKLDAMRADAAKRAPLDAVAVRRHTFVSWLRRYKEIYKAGLSDNTQRNYDAYIRIVGEVDSTTLLCNITAESCQQVVNLARSAYAARTVNGLIVYMRGAILRALEEGYISRDVMAHINTLNVEKVAYTHLKESDWSHLISYMGGVLNGWGGVLVTVERGTGMRRGELAGMEWPNLDLKAGTYKVSGQIALDKDGKPVKKKTKTEAAKRIIPLPKYAIAALKQWRKEQAMIRIASGSWEHPEMIFTSAGGRLITPEVISTAIKNSVQHTGIKTTLHNLRHNYATTLIMSGVDVKTAQYLLGHQSPMTTLKIYAEVVPDKVHTVAALMDAVAGGCPRGCP